MKITVQKPRKRNGTPEKAWLRAPVTLPDDGEIAPPDWTGNANNAYDFGTEAVASEAAELVGGSVEYVSNDPNVGPVVRIGLTEAEHEANRAARRQARQDERRKASEEAARLAEEQARLEAERVERERLAEEQAVLDAEVAAKLAAILANGEKS